MNRFWNCTLVAFCVAAGLSRINHLHEFARAQDATSGFQDSPNLGGGGKAKSFSTPSEMHQAAQAAKTVEDIRNFQVDAYSAHLRVHDLSSGTASLEHQRFPTLPEAKERLSQLRTGLRDPKSDRAGLEPELDKALNAYFVVDMKSRVTELDKIKERVKEMEVQLERRMKFKDEIIDLQRKVILSESNGLGFFSADERTGSSGLGDRYPKAVEDGEMSPPSMQPAVTKRRSTTSNSGIYDSFNQGTPGTPPRK